MASDEKQTDKADKNDFVEIVDNDNRPIAVLPKDMAHRQLLKHRSIQVLVFDTEKNSIFKNEIPTNFSFLAAGMFRHARIRVWVNPPSMQPCAFFMMSCSWILKTRSFCARFQHVRKRDSNMSPCSL